MSYDRSAFVKWMQEDELSDATIRSYLKSTDCYFQNREDITKAGVIEYKRDLIASGAKTATVNLRLCGIRAYIRFVGGDVSVRQLKSQKASSIDNVISNADYNRLLEGLMADGNMEGYYRVKFLAGTGARVSELIRLKKKHLDAGRAELYSKGKVRTIYIPASLISESAEYFSDLEPEDYLFQPYVSRYGHRRADKPIRRESIGDDMRRWSVKYGIPKEVMHPHSLRHRFAINFMKNNSDLTLLADVMGHSGVNTTMIYTRMSMDEQKDAVDKAVNW